MLEIDPNLAMVLKTVGIGICISLMCWAYFKILQ
jgi:hypothetical protein